MAVHSVGRIAAVQTPATVQETRAPAQGRRVEVGQVSSFERGSTADLGGFVPSVDPRAQAGIDALYARLDPARRERLQAAGERLGAALLAPEGGAATGTTSSAVQAATSEALALYLATTGADARSEVSRDFVTLLLGGLETELRGYAAKIQASTALSQEMGVQATELRDMLSDWPEGAKQSFTWREVTFDDEKGPTVTEHTQDLTKDEAQDLLSKLDDQKTLATGQRQLDQEKLTEVYARYQQAVETIAAIQKQTYDDAKAIISNLRA